MLVPVFKFIHLICVLLCTGLAVYGLYTSLSRLTPYPSLREPRENTKFIRGIHNYLVTLLSGALFFALITGSLLIYPKGYTFQTPWIRAAFFLVGISAMTLLSLNFLRRNFHKKGILLQSLIFCGLLCILILIIKDAVQKTTEIPLEWLGLS